MDAASEVIAFDRETLLVVLHRLLEVFHLLVAHAQEVESVCLCWALGLVFKLELDCLLEMGDCIRPLTQVVKDLTLEKMRLCILGVKLKKFGKDLAAQLYVFLDA